MATNWTLAFVDSIAASPTVRLNLDNGTAGPWNLRDGTRFDPPPMRRTVTTSILADGGSPTSSAYDNRTIELHLQLLNVTADAAATQLQKLVRELDRTSNLLMYKPDTSTPVFFRTYRSGPDAIEWNPVNREVIVTLLAEPFAYGLEQTLSLVTVTNNPAAGANGQFLDITSPMGDVETPLYLTIGGTIGVTGRMKSAIGVRRRGTVGSYPLVLQAEAMSQGTDTTTQPNSASFSGAGNNFSRCTFATLATGQRRIFTATTFPTASVDARGQYRVFVRGRQNTGTDSIDVRLQYGDTNAVVKNDIVRWPGNTAIQYVDLGVMQIPVGYDPIYEGKSGVELPTEGTYIDLFVRRNSGAGTFDMDMLLFLPADDALEFIKWPAVQASVNDTYIAEGGPRATVYCMNNSGQIRATELIEIAGRGLMITPGRTNRVFFVRDVGGTVAAVGTSDSLTATNSLTPSYFPRYLFVRPVTT